jgi:hypothetical protein
MDFEVRACRRIFLAGVQRKCAPKVQRQASPARRRRGIGVFGGWASRQRPGYVPKTGFALKGQQNLVYHFVGKLV